MWLDCPCQRPWWEAERRNGRCVRADVNEWKRKFETKVYKWGWVARCYSFIFSHIYSNLSFSIPLQRHSITLTYTHCAPFNPLSWQPCRVLHNSQRGGGRTGRMEGGREGGMEVRKGERGSRENDSRCNMHHNATLSSTAEIIQCHRVYHNQGGIFHLSLHCLFSFGWMFFAGFQCGNNSHWLIKLCSQFSKWCLNFNVLHACFIRNPIRSERLFLNSGITRIMNKRWDVWCHVVWKQIILTLEILHKRWLIVCVAVIIQESVNV